MSEEEREGIELLLNEPEIASWLETESDDEDD